MLSYMRLASSRSALCHFNNGSFILLNSYLPRNESHNATKHFAAMAGPQSKLSETIIINTNLSQANKFYSISSIRLYSQDAKKSPETLDDSVKKETTTTTVEESKLSSKDKLKKAVKEYGSTVVIFHVCISLISLGCCYLLISNELDVKPILEYCGWTDNKFISTTAATGTSTFVVAYALHKIFAPVRISITIGCTPFIVRYLRTRGILKK